MSKERKPLILILFIFLLSNILLCYSANERSFKPYLYPLPDLSFYKPPWFLFFNEVFPRAKFDFVIKNNSETDIYEGIIVLQIAEDKGLAIEPKEEEFKFLSYKLFERIRPNKKLRLVFNLSDEYRPGRFRIKPTLFIYPKGKSPIKSLYEQMKSQGNDVFKAWEGIYFSEWDKNLGSILGSLRREGGSYLLITRDFSTVISWTGLSILILIIFLIRSVIYVHKKFLCKDRKINKKSFKPKIYIKRAVKHRYQLGEIYNQGEEDIVDLKVIVKYIDKSGIGQEKEAAFINENEDPIFASYHKTSILRTGERKFIVNFPRTNVSIAIQGKGAKSQIYFEDNINIEAYSETQY